MFLKKLKYLKQNFKLPDVTAMMVPPVGIIDQVNTIN